jgi:hypothetical protein
MMYIHTPLLTPSLTHSLTHFLTHPSGNYCWIALDEDGRNKQTGRVFRFALQYAGGTVQCRTPHSLLTNSCVRVCVCAVWTICCVNFFLYYKMYMFMRALNTSNSACTSGTGSGTCTISNGNSMSGSSGSGSGSASRASFIMNSVRFLSRSTSASASTTTGGSGGESKAMQVVLRLRWYPGE